MPSSQNDESKPVAVQPKPPVTPDGKSKLPAELPGYPVTGGSDPGPTKGPMPK